MKLIGKLPSPFVRKTLVVLVEKALPFEMVVDGPSQPGNRIIEFSPLGKIPILVTDDGRRMIDSRVIVEYVDMLSEAMPMLPAPGAERIAVKRWEALADGICDAAVSIVAEGRRPASERSPAWIDKQRGKVERSIAVMARELDGRTSLHGSGPTLADFASAVALSYVEYRLPEVEWRGKFPDLSAFERRFAARPSFVRTANAPDRAGLDPA